MNLNERSLVNMQLINVQSIESLSKCHDSPKRTLHVQFSYYLLVFIRCQGHGICQLMCPDSREFAHFIKKMLIPRG